MTTQIIKQSPQHSKFWLENIDKVKKQYLNQPKDKYTQEYLFRLASIRRAIANFVQILTKKNIPVHFSTGPQSYTDRHKIVISASDNPDDFDFMVGLALHEASHIILSQWNKDNQDSIPWFTFIERYKGFVHDDLELATEIKRLGINQENVKKIIHNILLNWIEDRRIDQWTYEHAVGYRPYYEALYKQSWNSEQISTELANPKAKEPTFFNYIFHLINLTNPTIDLSALPGLAEISKLCDLQNISRFNKDSQSWIDYIKSKKEMIHPENIPPQIQLAVDIFTIILKNIKEISNEEIEQLVKGMTGQEEFDKQLKFMIGEIIKDEIDAQTQQKLSILEISDAKIEKTKDEVFPNIPVIVYKKFTSDMINSDYVHRGFCGISHRGGLNHEAITKGTSYGNILVNKLKLMADSSILFNPHQLSGKIDKRRISQIGVGAKDIFKTHQVEDYKPIFLHMSLDLSSSMCGNKWDQTLTLAVALAKVAQSLPIIDVVISLRAAADLPEVLIAYDSRTDSFGKINSLFPYIYPSGSTPEGLCFEVIKKEIMNTASKSRKFFVNLSDGQPTYNYSGEGKSFSYNSQPAYSHVARQMRQLEAEGVQILSYFISSGNSYDEQAFRAMYGRNASFVDVDNISGIAITLNNLFLDKEI